MCFSAILEVGKGSSSIRKRQKGGGMGYRLILTIDQDVL